MITPPSLIFLPLRALTQSTRVMRRTNLDEMDTISSPSDKVPHVHLKNNNKVSDEIFGTMVVVRWWMGKQNNWVGNKQTKTVLTNCIASFEKYRVPNLNFPIYDFDHSFDITVW